MLLRQPHTRMHPSMEGLKILMVGFNQGCCKGAECIWLYRRSGGLASSKLVCKLTHWPNGPLAPLAHYLTYVNHSPWFKLIITLPTDTLRKGNCNQVVTNRRRTARGRNIPASWNRRRTPLTFRKYGLSAIDGSTP